MVKSAIVMDGRPLAKKIKRNLAFRIDTMERKPGLAVISVGNTDASKIYENVKRKDCQECGIYYEHHHLPEDATSTDEIIRVINKLNNNDRIDGIVIQFPLPEEINEQLIRMAIRPDKDVECIHPINSGGLMLNMDCLLPCTPAAVMELLEEYDISTMYKTATVIGRSNIVGKPMAMLLTQRNATVTICHTMTPNLKEACLGADIIISAAGQPNLITADMVRVGATVIDVGINRDEVGNLCGDVDYKEVSKKAFWITPVPGGVGPVTRAVLMDNVLHAAIAHVKY